MTKHEKLIEEFERFIQEYDRDVGYTSYDKEILGAVLAQLKEPELVRRGKWIEKWFGYGYKIRCSECGYLFSQMTNYCPNCGAKMSMDEQEEKND